MNLLKKLAPYKDLLIIFIWREFSVRYRNSLIGILWAIIQPLSLMLLFTFIFTFVLKIQVGDTPRAIFFYSALLPWTFFASSLNYSVTSISSNHRLITRIYFPREVLPLSGIIVAFIDLLIASSLFVVLLIILQNKYNNHSFVGYPFSFTPIYFYTFGIFYFLKCKCLLQGCCITLQVYSSTFIF